MTNRFSGYGCDHPLVTLNPVAILKPSSAISPCNKYKVSAVSPLQIFPPKGLAQYYSQQKIIFLFCLDVVCEYEQYIVLSLFSLE